MFVKLAVRNSLRNKRRTIITLGSIVVGTVSIVLAGGFVNRMFEGIRESAIHSQFGHLQVYKAGYSEKGSAAPFDYTIKNFAAVKSTILSVPHVAYVTPRLSFAGLVSTGETTTACIGLGVDPEKETELGAAVWIISGIHLDGEEGNGAILGKGLASGMGVGVGDYLTVLSTTPEGSINGMEVKVRGIFESMAKEFDDRAMKVPLKQVQEMLGMEDEVQSMVVMLDKTEHTEQVKHQLLHLFQEKGLGLEIKTWSDLAHVYHAVVNMFTRFFSVITLIIAVIVILGIANTMTMAIFERTREIGTMMAIGTKRWEVLTLFVLEGLVLGLLGGGIGLGLGVVLAKAISAVGIPMPPPPGSTRGFIATSNVVPAVLWRAFRLAVVTAVLSSLYPAIKAARLRVVEALRHV